MQTSVIAGCNNNSSDSKGITFHLFPTNDCQKQNWILAIRAFNRIPDTEDTICSAHFLEEDIDSFGKIRENAVPQIFNALDDKDESKDESIASGSLTPETENSNSDESCADDDDEDYEYSKSEVLDIAIDKLENDLKTARENKRLKRRISDLENQVYEQRKKIKELTEVQRNFQQNLSKMDVILGESKQT